MDEGEAVGGKGHSAERLGVARGGSGGNGGVLDQVQAPVVGAAPPPQRPSTRLPGQTVRVVLTATASNQRP